MRAIVALALGLLSALASCASAEGVRVAAGAVGGHTSSIDVESLRGEDGTTVGGSLRVSRQSADFPALEPGFRLDVTYKNLSDNIGNTGIDYEGLEAGIAPMLRWRPFGSDMPLTPFADVFFGYTHNWVDLDRTAGALSVTNSGNDFGYWFGAGVGFELAVSEGTDLDFAVEGVWLDYDLGRVGSIAERRVQGFVGLSHRF